MRSAFGRHLGRRIALALAGPLFASVLLALGAWSSPAYADTPHCGTISADEVWTSAGNSHTVTCDVVVQSGATLTITQGTIVKFGSTRLLTVNGSLVALGTASEPITMTANTAIPTAGFWKGLYFESGSQVHLDHVAVEYAGAYDYSIPNETGVEVRSSDVSLSHTTLQQSKGIAVYAETSLTLTNSLITGSSGYPVRVHASDVSASQMGANTFSGNLADAFLVGAAALAGNHTWPSWVAEHPVHIDWLAVGSGAALSLPPGTALHLGSDDVLDVYGALTAIGTASEPITLTANSAAPAAGFWRGLYFNPGSAGDLEYVTVEYAGKYDFGEPYWYTGVEIHSSNVSLSHATVRECLGTGVYATGDVSLESSTVTGCTWYGVNAAGSITLTDSLVSGNGSYGLRLSAPVISGSVFTGTVLSGNSPDAVQVAAATLEGSHTWPSWVAQYPVHIDGTTLAVGAGGALTLPTGISLGFGSASEFLIDGALTAPGTVSAPITMTANSSTPTPGFWKGLYFGSGSVGDLKYVTVEYAGSDDFFAPYYTGVEIDSSGISLSHATIRDCIGTGVYATGDVSLENSTVSGCTYYGVNAGGSITLTDSLISDNDYFPLRISAPVIGASVFTGTVLTGNAPDAVEVAGATLVGSHAWPSWMAQYPVHVAGTTLAVGSGGALSLPAGISLEFGSAGEFVVDGALTALGTASAPITMTANTATPTAGFWKGLYFNGGSVGDLDHVTVEYGGANDFFAPTETGVEIDSSGVSLSNATVRYSLGLGIHATTGITLTGCAVINSTEYPVRIPAGVIGDSQISANTFSGNGADALSVGGDTVTGNHAWPPWMAEYPVYIDWLAVGSGASLALPAGISLHFPADKAFDVYGTLTAPGTVSAPITLTANTATPTAGFWRGLYFNGGSAGDLDHVTVEYAGSNDYDPPNHTGVEIDSTGVSLSHSMVRECVGTGVYATGDVSLENSTVTGCTYYGVNAGGSVTLTNSLVSDNGSYGLRISAPVISTSAFTGTVLAGNTPNAVEVAGATLVGSHAWSSWLSQYPVHVDGPTLAVGTGGALALPAGMSLGFGSAGEFLVDGALTALGTASAPITMTANAVTPTVGFWKGLYFNNGGVGDLDYVTVEYAGSDDYFAPKYTGVEIDSNDVSLSHATVRQCAGTGVYATGDVSLEGATVSGCTYYGVNAGGSITLTDSLITDNGGYPLRLSAPAINDSVFTGTVLAGNTPNAVEVAGATLAGSHTWPPWLAQYPVHIDGPTLAVGAGGALSLPAGMSLGFGSGAEFLVDGALTAPGTANAPITMTANAITPTVGFWKGLYFNSGSVGSLDFVTVEYAGSDDYFTPNHTCLEIDSSDVSLSHATVRECLGTGVYATGDIGLESSTVTGCTYYGVIAGGSITLTDSLISDNGGYPLRISAPVISASVFTGTVLAGNTPNAVEVAGATLVGSHTWPPWLAQYPVHIDGLTLAVGAGGALSLPAGMSLGFGSAGEFLVDGALTALGTASAPITMTANAITPTVGFWKGLYFNSGGVGDLDYVTVEYAGAFDFFAPTETGVEIDSSDVVLSHATIRHCAGTGVHATGNVGLPSSTVTGCTGVGIYAGGTITLTDSVVSDNDDYPLRISAASISGSVFTGTTFAGNTPDAILVEGTTLTGNHAWSPWLANYPIHLDWLKVGAAGALSLPGGVGLHFDGLGSFYVDGTLVALGTSSMPITMTVNSDAPTHASWHGLYFTSGSTGDLDYVTVEYAGRDDGDPLNYTGVEIHNSDVRLSHATIRYCGGTGVYTTGAGNVSLDSTTVISCTAYGVYAGGSITLTDSYIGYNGDYALRIPAASIGASSFAGNTFAGNAPDAILVVGDTLAGNHAWSPWLASYPVHLDFLRVGVAGSLVLPAGIELYFDADRSFYVDGTLEALGTSSMPITMTVNLDSPAPASWKGLYFSSGSTGDLEYVTVEYAGSNDGEPFNYTGVEIHNSDVRLSHTTIRYCGGSGVYTTGAGNVSLESSTVISCTRYGVYAGGSITLTNSHIGDNGDYPLRIPAASIGSSSFAGNTFVGNTPDATLVPGETLTGHHAWSPWLASYPLHLNGLRVGAAGVLVLPAGVGLYFDADSSFHVDGTLEALGTSSMPVLLTANTDTPAPASWRGLYFTSGSTGDLVYLTVEYAGQNDGESFNYTGVEIHSSDVTLSHATIRYCGGTGVYTTGTGDVSLDSSTVISCTRYGVYAGGSITLTNSLIGDNADYALRVPASSIGTSAFSGNTFSGNAVDAILVPGEILADTHVWPASLTEYPVHVDWLTVDDGASLTLPAGAALYFNEHKFLKVDGTLVARGTPTTPITLTVNSPAPSAGSWQGLYLHGVSTGALEYVTLEYAGDNDFSLAPSQTGLEIRGPSVSVSHVTVQHNAGSGMYVATDAVLDDLLVQDNSPEGIRVAKDATVLVENSVVISNTEGVFADNAHLTIVDSHIVDNDIYGVHNNTSSRPVMATYNWWGDPSGPYHPNTNVQGLGNEVSDHVIYRPWRVVDTRPLDLAVRKTGPQDPIMVHTNLTYTLVITNSGPEAAPGVALNDSLPPGVTFISAMPSRGNCAGSSLVVCAWDLIDFGETITVTILVAADNLGLITNEATVTTLAPDRHDANNHASVTTEVVRNSAYSYIFLPFVTRR